MAAYLFKGVSKDHLKTRNTLSYLKQKANYYELREKIEKAEITTLEMDALEYFKQHPDERFGYIDITNILLFIYQLAADNDPAIFKEKIKIIKDIYNNNLQPGGVLTLDYFFGIRIDDLDKEFIDLIQEYIRNIYREIYNQLKENFNLESFTIPKLIAGFGPKEDTVLLARKM